MSTPAPGSPAGLRDTNQQRLVAAVRLAGSLSQAEIARSTGLSPATVSNIVRRLAGSGLLRTVTGARGGRRATVVSLSRAAGIAVGIDFGHQHVQVAAADLSHEVLGEARADLARDHPADAGLSTAAALVTQVLHDAGIGRREVVGVGMGLPGPIDVRTGLVGSSSILPGWIGVRAEKAMAERLSMGVLVDNDANLGALAEVTWGAARGTAHAAYIKVSTGIGAGLVINGRLFRGAIGTAGEIGHTTIDENGPICRCGNRGCLETFASIPVLLEMLARSHGTHLSPRDLVDLAVAGDSGCRRVVQDAGRHVGLAVANLCNLVNPEIVVIGGELARAGDLVLDPLRDVVRRFAIPAAASATTIVAATLGERAQVLGALALALESAGPLIGAATGRTEM